MHEPILHNQELITWALSALEYVSRCSSADLDSLYHQGDCWWKCKTESSSCSRSACLALTHTPLIWIFWQSQKKRFGDRMKDMAIPEVDRFGIVMYCYSRDTMYWSFYPHYLAYVLQGQRWWSCCFCQESHLIYHPALHDACFQKQQFITVYHVLFS